MSLLLKSIFAALLSIPFLLWSQNEALEPCGTRISHEVRTWFQGLDPAFRNNLKIQNGELYVPVIIHIVGDDNGNGYFPKDQAFQLICELNRHYIPASIRFFLADTFYYINNTRYYNHDWSDGYEMMDIHNLPPVMNVYVVQNPADACGYAYYPGGGPGARRGGIALAKACSRPGNSTLAHEVGHYLSLPHTFDNWNNTGLTELVDGSNCSSAGDYFCDTPADFLDFRWNCPYTGSKLDPNGDAYQPDGTLFMSYSIEPCGRRFSPEQMDAMRTSRTLDRSYLNSVPPPAYSGEQTVSLVLPTDSAQVPVSGFMLRWNAVPGVTQYAGMISPMNSFTFSTVKFITTDTFYYVSQALDAGRTYRWKIAPLNPYYPCIDPDSTQNSRVLTPCNSITQLDPEVENILWTVAPVPALASETISLHTPPGNSSEKNWLVMDLSGKILLRSESMMDKNTIPGGTLPPGIYIFVPMNNIGREGVQRIILY